MRTFPTFDKVFKMGDNYEFDRFQETAVYPIEPLIILNTSKDGNWYFAQMYNYLSWIPKSDVAICSREELFRYIKAEDFIVTTGNYVVKLPTRDNSGNVEFKLALISRSEHALIYLGDEEGIHYAIHDFSGYYNSKGDGGIEYHKCRRVMAAPLNIGLSEDGKTYIKGIYGARDFVL